MKALFAVMAMFGLASCAGKVEITRPVSPQAGTNVKVISKSRDEVWTAAVPALGKQYFVINNLDRSSGLINISYTGDPERYIDCGQFSSYVKNVRGERTYRFPAASASQSYEVMTPQGQLLSINRRMALEGRMNLVFEVMGPNQTRVSANTRYIVTRQADVRNTDGRTSSFTHNISFNSGSQASFPMPSDGNQTHCVPTGALESEVLILIN